MNHTLFNNALATLPADLAANLTKSLGSTPFSGKIPASVLEPLLQQPQALMQWLPFAAQFAITPVSNFMVGAMVVGHSGAGYIGANFEFEAQPLGQSVHGEQAAINNAWLHGETGISHLFVNASPCGHCRQFIREIAEQAQLQVWVSNKTQTTFSQLLPDSFGPEDLGNAFALFQQPQQAFTVNSDNPDVQAITEQAKLSYAPYTGYYHGLGLQTDDNRWFIGRYAENAAYNPSLPALQSALSQLRFAGYQSQQIKQAILVHKTGQKIDMSAHYQATLLQLNSLKLAVYELS